MPQLGDAPWTTWYLHTDGAFAAACPRLRQRLLDLAADADREQGWGLLSGDREIMLRTVELHEVKRGGALPDPRHFDGGSLVTVDLMLSRPSDFEGGSFTTLEADGRQETYRFERGDALVFVSHK